MIFDLMFRPKRERRMLSWAIKGKLHQQKEELERDFEHKIRMVTYDFFEKGISARKEYDLPVIRVPMFDISEMPFAGMAEVDVKVRPIETIRLAMHDIRLSKQDIERVAETALSQEIIKRGYLNCTPERDNTLLFSINVFE